MHPSTFEDLKLLPALVRAVHDEGYVTPTPIQLQTIPSLLLGRDLLGCAQTGTGKTAAFALPILQRLTEAPKPPQPRTARVLVLTPTRELAAQIGESFRVYGRHLHVSHTVIFGGVGQDPQVRAMASGVHVLVATPGRLLDLMNQRLVRLDGVEVFVLDEADRMLDMGFIPDVRRVMSALPRARQTLLFSATMPREVQGLATSLLKDPVRVAVTPEKTTADGIDDHLLFVGRQDKTGLLAALLVKPEVTRALVFTRTKHGANRVVKQLARYGIMAEALHGNKSQSARTRALDNFRSGRTPVLVATDIAARGLDVEAISHVINYDLPVEPEAYVHRIGRTARAGARGIAISLCGPDERAELRDIERLLGRHVPVIDGRVHLPEPPLHPLPPPAHSTTGAPRQHQGQGGGHGRRPSRDQGQSQGRPGGGGGRRRRTRRPGGMGFAFAAPAPSGAPGGTRAPHAPPTTHAPRPSTPAAPAGAPAPAARPQVRRTRWFGGPSRGRSR